MNEELGPCPLCGWKATRHQRNSGVWCSNKDCDLKVALMSDANWNRLSALAEQNKRRGEALKWCREWFRTWNHAPGDPEMLSPEALEKLCEEALKNE